jgi:hypothetical protein
MPELVWSRWFNPQLRSRHREAFVWSPTIDTGAQQRPPAGAESPLPRFLGWIMIAPAVLLLLFQFVWPTLDLLYTSLTWPRTVGGGPVQSPFSSFNLEALGFALSIAGLPILILATLAPAFAWAASRAGLAGRWVARAALVLPLAAFAPVGLAALYLWRRLDSYREQDLLPNEYATVDSRVVMVATMGAFLFAVGVTCYLAALRRREPRVRTWPALVVVGTLLAIVATGAAVQHYTFPDLVFDSHLGGGSGPTPMSTAGIRIIQLGLPLIVLPIVALLGVAATVLVVKSRLRMEFDPAMLGADDRRGRPGLRAVAVAGTAVGVVAVLVLVVVQLGPWLSALTTGGAELPDRYEPRSVFLVTWLFPLATALVQVVTAALAAFGIAVVRPLGRHSEWLLLLWAPWLLVGNGLLVLPRLDPETEGLQPLIAYAPPSWVSLPALVVFTLLFRGQAAQWRQARGQGQPYAFVRTMWPVLPMAVLAAGIVWLLQAQDLLVPQMMDGGQGVVPNAQLILARPSLGIVEPEPSIGYPLWILVLLTLGLLVMQLGYLDRVAVRTGRTEEPPAAGHGRHGGPTGHGRHRPPTQWQPGAEAPRTLGV